MFDWTIGPIVGCVVGIFGAWGALWYKMGKIAAEVKGHNKILGEVKSTMDSIREKMEG